MNIQDFITVDPNRRFGKPTLIGTRITVSDILNWLGNGMTEKEILADYPELSEAMIRAALIYAATRQQHLGFAS